MSCSAAFSSAHGACAPGELSPKRHKPPWSNALTTMPTGWITPSPSARARAFFAFSTLSVCQRWNATHTLPSGSSSRCRHHAASASTAPPHA
eukprot:6995946-Prymnesium_polylepis.1